jgi:hypothetical protein
MRTPKGTWCIFRDLTVCVKREEEKKEVEKECGL